MQEEVETLTMFGKLPQSLKTAQQAIELPEVQEIIQKLSKYNLGVFMPHQHNLASGDFEVLPDDVIQVEDDLQVSFMSKIEADQLNALPVGWVWRKDGVTGYATCVKSCSYVTTPGGNVAHIKNYHNE